MSLANANKPTAPNATVQGSNNGSIVTVPFTVSDLVTKYALSQTAVNYHVLFTGFGSFSAIGNALGMAAYGMSGGVRRKYPLLVCTGTASLGMGIFGAAFGWGGLQFAKRLQSPERPPWDQDGIDMRARGMQYNPRVRLLDALPWTGIGAAAGTLLWAGSPVALGYSAGALGVAQVLSHGSAFGGTLAMGLIALDRQKETELLKELDLDGE